MAVSLETLRGMTDDEVAAAYDEQTRSQGMSTEFYLNELDRRAQRRAAEASDRLARRTLVLSVVSTLIALAALVVTILK